MRYTFIIFHRYIDSKQTTTTYSGKAAKFLDYKLPDHVHVQHDFTFYNKQA